MGLEIIFLLLPVAALSGWLIGRRSASRPSSAQHLSPDYFRGLNYLLNEEPDRAIDVFINILDVDGETVETHFALASLFRRRGEADRAVRIHQNLIARPNLTREQRNQALFELGRDYLAAGLLDRAESLFSELSSDSVFGQRALTHLLEVYQQEREWDNAIKTARRLQVTRGTDTSRMTAHFLCEKAERALNRQQPKQSLELARRALSEDKNCVRASLIEGRAEQMQGHHKQAIRAFKRIGTQDPDFLVEAIEPLKDCLEAVGKPMELISFLTRVLNERDGFWLRKSLAEQLRDSEPEQAEGLMRAYVNARPSIWGLGYLTRLKAIRAEGAAESELEELAGVVDRLVAHRPKFRCSNCGFSAQALHWQCPSCKEWGTVRPHQADD